MRGHTAWIHGKPFVSNTLFSEEAVLTTVPQHTNSHCTEGTLAKQCHTLVETLTRERAQEDQAEMGTQEGQADAYAQAKRPWHHPMGSMQARQRCMSNISLRKKDRQDYFAACLKRHEEQQRALAEPNVVDLTLDHDPEGEAA